MTSSLVESLKSKHSIEGVLRENGVELGRDGKCLCPFHKEKSPSCQVFDDGKWKCFGCGAAGDVVDLMAHFAGKPTNDYLRDHPEKNGFSGSATARPAARPHATTPPQSSDEREDRASAHAPEISFDWASCRSKLTDALAASIATWRGLSAELVRTLREYDLIGLYTPWPPDATPCVAFPVSSDTGQTIGCHYRLNKESAAAFTAADQRGRTYKEGDWMYSKGAGARPLIIGDPMTATECLLFESQWDALAVADALGWHEGRVDKTAFIVTRGSQNGKNIRGIPVAGTRLVAVPQNDKPKAGDKFTPAEKWLADIRETLSDFTVFTAQIPRDHKDANDWRKAGASDDEVLRVISQAQGPRDPWALVDLADFITTQEKTEQPLQIVENFIEKGTKVIFGGASKSKKTWSMLDLALSVGFGKKFWGMATSRVKVLHIDFELKPKKLSERVQAIARAKGIIIDPGWVFPLSLRGQMTNPDIVLQKIKERALEIGAGLITIDPAYKFYAGKDENKAGDIAIFLNSLEQLVVLTDAAVIIANHFSKGNQAAKDPMDRIAGSGVWARDADTLFVMTAHEEDECLTVSPILRNFKEIPEFVVRWNYPLMERADDLDPSKLKQIKPHNAGLAERRALECMDILREKSLTYTQWMNLAEIANGTKTDAFKKYFGILKKEGQITEFQGKWRIT